MQLSRSGPDRPRPAGGTHHPHHARPHGLLLVELHPLLNDTMEFDTYDLGELGHHYNRYIAAMQHWQAALPPGRVLHLPSELMVVDLEHQARQVIAHIGLPWS